MILSGLHCYRIIELVVSKTPTCSIGKWIQPTASFAEVATLGRGPEQYLGASVQCLPSTFHHIDYSDTCSTAVSIRVSDHRLISMRQGKSHPGHPRPHAWVVASDGLRYAVGTGQIGSRGRRAASRGDAGRSSATKSVGAGCPMLLL